MEALNWAGCRALESYKSMTGRLNLQNFLAPSGSAARREACCAEKFIAGCWSPGILEHPLRYLQPWLEPLAKLSPSVLQTKVLALLLTGGYFCLKYLYLRTCSNYSQKPSTGRGKMELTHPLGDTWSQERRSYFLNKKQGVVFSKSIKICIGKIHANFLPLRMEWGLRGRKEEF